MSSERKQLPQEEWFDSLAARMKSVPTEQFLGSFNRMIELGKVAIRYSVFDPRERDKLPASYSPSILFQYLVKKQAHEGEYWAPIIEIHLRRNSLDSEETAEQLTRIDAVLDIIQ